MFGKSRVFAPLHGWSLPTPPGQLRNSFLRMHLMSTSNFFGAHVIECAHRIAFIYVSKERGQRFLLLLS